MHFEHKFHKGIRKLHKNLRPDQDFSNEFKAVEHHRKDDQEVKYLNSDEKRRHLHSDDKQQFGPE